MRISFIIPYHNEPESMLRECVVSILNLSLHDNEREVIVVDDGSNASPEPLLKKLHCDIIYIHQENQGLSVARNTGIAAATGDYIQFIDSDDALISNVYERVISKVRETQMDMLIFRFTYDTAMPKGKQLSRCYEGWDFLLHENLRAAAWCYIFRKECLGDLRFHQGIFHEDALFSPQLIIRSKALYVLKEKAYFYRQHKGTIMNNRNEQHITKRLNDSLFVLLELQRQSSGMTGNQLMAMQRCINQQTMCYIYTMLQLHRPITEIRTHIAKLKNHDLYPLPLKPYTWKYWFFAFITKLYSSHKRWACNG